MNAWNYLMAWWGTVIHPPLPTGSVADVLGTKRSSPWIVDRDGVIWRE